MRKKITSIKEFFLQSCRDYFENNVSEPTLKSEKENEGSSSLKSRLAKQLVAGAAAVAMAAGPAGDASAAIVSWNNANLVIPATIDGMYINVQTQVTGSAGSVVAGWDINPYSATSLTWFNATGTGMMRYPGVTTGSAGNLALGTTVGATGSYGSGAVVVGSAAGNWQLNADNYFGFRFIAADGLTHYGWGRMTVGAAITSRTIADLHFEDVPTTPIVVGSTLAGGFCLAPTLSATTVAAVCQGSSDGSINLTVTGGTPSPFTYAWSTGATSEDLSNVAAGTYTVTVTTQGGSCSATGSYTVADGPAPTLWFADSDGDGYGNASGSQSACTQPSGYVADSSDCNDSDNSVNPGVAADDCNGVDNDCDGSIDEDPVLTNYYVDGDGDGYGAGAATSSCTPVTGSVTTDGDCNDTDASINPSASETCNGLDDDCDGSTDEGLTAPTTTATACGSYTWSVNSQTYTASGTYTAGNASSSIYTSLPAFTAAVSTAGHTLSATETFTSFNGYYSSLSGSFGGSPSWSASANGGIYCGTVGGDMTLSTNNPEPLTISFSPSVAAVGGNIFLTDINFNPVSGTLYISLSNGTVDTVSVSSANNFSGYVSNSAQISSITIAGAGAGVVFVTIDNFSVGTGTITPPLSCNNPVLVLTITSGSTYYEDADGDGYGNAASYQSACTQPTGYVSNLTDCNDGNNSVNPGVASDDCNGVDNDCDGAVDDNATYVAYYQDSDADGYGAGAPNLFCAPVSGYVSAQGDCDDGNNAVNPDATEVCNSIDDDCDGSVDEGTSPAAVSINGNATGCLAVAAGSSSFSVSPAVSSVTYTWTLPAGMTLVSGQGTDQISVSWTLAAIENGITGNITVTPSSGCGTAATASIPVDLNYTAPVRPSSISGAPKLCPGDVATYSVAPVSRATGYVWTLPAGISIVSGAGTNVIGVSVTGSYIGGDVECRGSNVCGTGASRTRAVTTNLLSSPGSVTGATTGICSASGVNYSVAAVTGATGYDWTVPTGVTLVSGQGTSMISVNFDAGFTSGSITVASVNGCGNGAARSVSVSGSPERPGFITGDVTICPGQSGVSYGVPTAAGSSNYLWTVPTGTSIVSGLGSKDIVTNWGTNPASSLTVSVRASNACGNSISRGLNGISIGTINCGSPRLESESVGEGMTLFPNPATENFELAFSSLKDQPYVLMIVDATGKVVVSENGVARNGRNKVMVNISDLSSGIYLVSCEMNGKRQTTRLTK